MSACWLGQESFLARLSRRYYTEIVGNVGLAVRSSFTCHVAGAGRADHHRWPDRLFKFHPIPAFYPGQRSASVYVAACSSFTVSGVARSPIVARSFVQVERISMTLDTILTASSEIHRRRPSNSRGRPTAGVTLTASSKAREAIPRTSARGYLSDVNRAKSTQRGDAAKLIPSRIRSRNTIRLVNVNDSTAAIVQHLHRPTDDDGCYLRSQAWGLSQADRRARRPADASGCYLRS
jgi:hypothetical protein